MSMIDAGAKEVSKAKDVPPVAMGNRNEVKYRSAGDLVSYLRSLIQAKL